MTKAAVQEGRTRGEAGTVTAKALGALRPGDRLSAGQRAYFRRNSNGTISGYQRLPNGTDKVAGQSKGEELTRAELTAMFAAFERMREQARRAVNAVKLGKRAEGRPLADVDPTVDAKPVSSWHADAPLAEVWRDMLHRLMGTGKWTPRNMRTNKQRVQKHIRPSPLWDMPIAQIGAPQLQALLGPLRRDTPAQERKLWGLLAMVFTHAQTCGVIAPGSDPVPAARRMMDNLSKRPAREHFPAYTERPALRKLVADMRNMTSEVSVRAALMLQAYTCQRSTEVTGAEWREFELDPPKGKPARWVIPRERMKIKGLPYAQELHLPPPLVAFLKTLPRTSRWVFVNERGDGPITVLDKAMRVGLERKGEHVPHGWRSALETLTSDLVGKDGRPMFLQQWVDAVLDHKPSGVKQAYRRANAVDGGARVLAWWCDQLGPPLGK